jgi:hypothetical protein
MLVLLPIQAALEKQQRRGPMRSAALQKFKTTAAYFEVPSALKDSM